MDLLTALDQTFTHTSGVIAGVEPASYADKTPCTEWTVRDLLEHMIGVVDGLGHAAAGEPAGPFVLAADPAAQFDSLSTYALQAWRAPGALDRVVEIRAGSMPGHAVAGINLLDTATHAWDLAIATGQPADLPEPVAAAALEASRQFVPSELRAGRFGPEQAAPEGASTTEQLVAFLGRSVPATS